MTHDRRSFPDAGLGPWAGAVPSLQARRGILPADLVPHRAPVPCPVLPHPLHSELETLARVAGSSTGLSVEGLQVLTHRIPMTVQVLVRWADGRDVSLDDCAAFSGPLGAALEEANLLGDIPWVLEVSSPGIGDDLSQERDFISFRGFPVEVIRRGEDGRESRQDGLLVGRDDQEVLLNVRGRTVRIPRDQVVRVGLVSPEPDP